MDYFCGRDTYYEMEPISAVVGGLTGWLLPGPETAIGITYYITRWLNNRKLDSSIARNNILLEDMLFPDTTSGLTELLLSNCETYAAETLGSAELYAAAGRIRERLFSFSSTVSAGMPQACSKNQAREFKKNYEDAKNLAVKYLETTNVALIGIITGNLDAKVLQEIGLFVPLLENIYKARELGANDIHAFVKQFEEQHQNSDFCRLLRETRLHLKKRVVTNDMKRYIIKTANKFRENMPPYKSGEHFDAKYLGNTNKWSVKTDLESGLVLGYQAQGPLVLECRLLGDAGIKIESLAHLEERCRQKEKCYALCFVVPEATSEELQIIRDFPASGYFTPYIYETDLQRLTFNPKSKPAQIYASYFYPAKQPMKLQEIMALYADGPHTATLMMDLPVREVAKMKTAGAMPTALPAQSTMTQREVLYA